MFIKKDLNLDMQVDYILNKDLLLFIYMQGFITEPVKVEAKWTDWKKDYNTIRIMGLAKVGFDPHLKIITKDWEEHRAMWFENFELKLVEPNNYTSDEYGEKKQIKLIMEFGWEEYRLYANLTDVSVGILNCIASETNVSKISIKFGWKSEIKNNKDKVKENLSVQVFLNWSDRAAKWKLDRKGKDLDALAWDLFKLINPETRSVMEELQWISQANNDDMPF